jgi:putative tricarboxylic transport membrane protein
VVGGHHLRRLIRWRSRAARRQALTAAFTSSFVGALLRGAADHLPGAAAGEVRAEVRPAEFFAVQLLTFCSFIGMSKEPPAKTLAAMMLGFALAAVGMDTVTGSCA